MGKKRILFGAVDIGYRIEHYSKFISEHLSEQLEAESFSKYVLPESHYKTNYTYTCPIDKTHPIILYLYSFGFFIFSLFRYDIFHFLSGETLLTRKFRRFELYIYKLLGKKVIMHFVGADIRSSSYLDWKREHIHEFLSGKENPFDISEDFQKKLIDDARKYADYILVSSPDLLEIIPEATFFPVLIDIEQLESINKNHAKIKILYSPSSNRTKGSKYVQTAIENIEKNKWEQVEVINPSKNISNHNQYALTRYELLKELSQAHIVIDQMIIGWYGLKSVEALASGCEVVCYIEESLKQYLLPDSPIIVADVNTLDKELNTLINKLYKNREANLKNIEWAKKYHTIEHNNETLKKAWSVS